MAGIFLSQADRNRLQKLVPKTEDAALKRRMQVILLYDDGLSTREVAGQVGLSQPQTRHWRLQFERQGFEIFHLDFEQPDAGSASRTWRKTGRPVKEIKKARGYASPKLSTQVNPGDAVAEAARKVLRRQFAQLLKYEKRVRTDADDIEAVHDMRVATRRMRAAFDLFEGVFRKKDIRAHLKGLRTAGKMLGAVRDLEVMLDNAGRYLRELPEDSREGAAPLLEFWRRRWAAARQRLLEYLDDESFEVFKAGFDQFLAQEGAGARKPDAHSPFRVCECAPVWLYQRYADARTFGPGLESLSLEELHDLRLRFKRLRYAVEFFADVLGETSKDLVTGLKKVQDHLGELNDAHVAALAVRSFLDDWQAAQNDLPVSERRSPAPMLTYLSALHTVMHDLSVAFPGAWQDFNDSGFRRKLALAVAEL
ncbi:MAG: CHAD domain-containing protein [Anaerolineales bacterium]|nr:CHAD domain-containing protein [Anaerolineales bacterium]